MFGINGFALSLWSSLAIFCLWGIALIFAQIWKYSWFWIDDKDTLTENIILNHLRKFSKYKNPIYRSGIIYSYAKDVKYKNTPWCQVPVSAEWIPVYHAGRIVLMSSLFPIIIWIGIKIYPVVLAVVILITIANLARFTRRLSKKYNLHVNDNDVHVKKEE
ncbi:MAG: hypothetical protein GY793_06590 [Proteobacteria bacterium]|nr:hypothetical protein [Pseudomonadota bacterium]